MHNVRYDFSSCHVDVPSPLADEIIDWGRSQVHDDDLYITYQDLPCGREDEIHVTILYGIHGDSGDQVRSLIEHTGPVTIKLGKVSVFTNPLKYDVVMIDAESDDLIQLNLLLQQEVRFTNKHPVYNPHVTIAYVKKGKGWKHKGLPLWDGRELTCNYAVFSSKNGTKERIIL